MESVVPEIVSTEKKSQYTLQTSGTINLSQKLIVCFSDGSEPLKRKNYFQKSQYFTDPQQH